MKLLGRLLGWLAYRLSEHIYQYLQIGAHCGLCGKWVPNEIAWKPWAWTVCDKCRDGKYE